MSAKRKCVFNDHLQRKFPCFAAVANNNNQANCTICKVTVSVANKGKYDLEQHINSQKHKSTLRAGQTSQHISDFVVMKNTKQEQKVLAAEATLAFHTLKHHFSYRSTNCTSLSLPVLFDDSETAKRISSAKTKTRAIANHIIAPYIVRTILKELEKVSFVSVSTDGSNHGSTKLFPFMIQYFDKRVGIMTKLLDLQALKNETADTISDYIVNCLNKFKICEKCASFSADNCNTNFGGLRRAGERNVYQKLKSKINNSNLLGLGCSAHIVHNAIQHGFDTLSTDLESIILKIYNHFSIYTVRTENLKDFCDFVEVEYRELLKHSKTRWLSLYPCVDRLLQMFPALKSYFLSTESSPVVIKAFFENRFSEPLLLFAHSLMYLFHGKNKQMEAETNSLLEIKGILSDLKSSLNERYATKFLPLKVKSLINQAKTDGYEQEADIFVNSVLNVYKSTCDYLNLWTEQLSSFDHFDWMSLKNVPEWDAVQTTIQYLEQKGVEVEETKCFDQYCNLKAFLKREMDGAEFKQLLSPDKWVRYFNQFDDEQFYSELLKIAQFFFALAGHNANVERVFSLLTSQWTKERNRLKVSTVRGILTVVYNYKEISCKEFYNLVKNEPTVLNEIKGSDKYSSSDSD